MLIMLQTLLRRRPSFLTDDVVTELPETRQLRRAVGAHVQDVPDILIGALKAAEPEEKTNGINTQAGRSSSQSEPEAGIT